MGFYPHSFNCDASDSMRLAAICCANILTTHSFLFSCDNQHKAFRHYLNRALFLGVHDMVLCDVPAIYLREYYIPGMYNHLFQKQPFSIPYQMRFHTILFFLDDMSVVLSHAYHLSLVDNPQLWYFQNIFLNNIWFCIDHFLV